MTEEEDQYMDWAVRRRTGSGGIGGRKIKMPAFYRKHEAALRRRCFPNRSRSTSKV
jgi:hypothetical protein